MTFPSTLLFCPTTTTLTTRQRHPSDEWDNSWLSPEDQCKWEMENATNEMNISSIGSLHCGSLDCNESIVMSMKNKNPDEKNLNNHNTTTNDSWSIPQQIQLWFQSLVDSVDVACGTPEHYDFRADGTKLDGYPMERFVPLQISPTKDDVQEFATRGDLRYGAFATSTTTNSTGHDWGGHTTRTYWDDESAI